jgi:nucleotide-binding universal stress UspA family protein
METPPEQTRRSRILVGLDASRHGLAALEAAARLAAEMQAELTGLFVEDANLFRLAALPFATEIDPRSARARRFELSQLEGALRAQAADLRRTMAALAEQLRVDWSFDVVRGDLIVSALSAATGADLLIMARQSGAPKRTRTLGDFSQSPNDPILVAYDGSPAAHRAFEAAVRIAARFRTHLNVLLVASDAADCQQLTREVQDLAGTVPVEVCMPHVADVRSLAQSALRFRGSALVINRDCRLLDENSLRLLVDQLEHPVVLVS